MCDEAYSLRAYKPALHVFIGFLSLTPHALSDKYHYSNVHDNHHEEPTRLSSNGIGVFVSPIPCLFDPAMLTFFDSTVSAGPCKAGITTTTITTAPSQVPRLNGPPAGVISPATRVFSASGMVSLALRPPCFGKLLAGLDLPFSCPHPVLRLLICTGRDDDCDPLSDEHAVPAVYHRLGHFHVYAIL